MPRIASINVYPLKSCRGFSPESWPYNERGFLFDREWMIVSEKRANFVSQRELPRMALIEASLSKDLQKLIINIPSIQKSIEIDTKLPTFPRMEIVTLWKNEYTAIDQGDEAAQFLSEFLKFKVRLVRTPAELRREPPQEFCDDEFNQIITSTIHKGDTSIPKPLLSVAFPDAFPFLLTTDLSHNAVNKKIASTFETDRSAEMIRFRPNIVITGSNEPFIEDSWKTLRIVSKDHDRDDFFYCASSCPRCTIPNVNPQEGKKDLDVRGVLNTFRRNEKDGEPLFGVYLVCTVNKGLIQIGDEIIPGDTKPFPKLLPESTYKA
jgi:uncharacterized protein YcbX